MSWTITLPSGTRLRTFSEREAALLPIRKAYAFEPIRYYSAGSGAGAFTAENQPPGAIVNYYLKEPVAGEGASVALVVRDESGAVVAEVPGANQAGFQRRIWDLRGLPPASPEGTAPQTRQRQGPMVEPGIYSVSLEARGEGGTRVLGGPQAVEVVALPGSVR